MPFHQGEIYEKTNCFHAFDDASLLRSFHGSGSEASGTGQVAWQERDGGSLEPQFGQ